MPADLLSIYLDLAAKGDVRCDTAQLAAVTPLTHIQTHLETTSKRRNGGVTGWLSRAKPDAPKGLYLWGGVGTGKSMLMDLFFDSTEIIRKRRVHFHPFMQEIHDAIHLARNQGVADPIDQVAKKVAATARLLCFDEMQITDITDAMIVGRLFEALFQAGTIIVATSNRTPDALYQNGLNRQLFLPFIALIKHRMTVHHLKSETDYRQDRLRGQQTWFHPLGKASTASLDAIWADLTGGTDAPLTLRVKSRDVTLPRAKNGLARASFADLCEVPLGPRDFLAIAAALRLLILDNIPKMSRARNNEAKRFVTLIDTLYEAKTQLICSAATEPEQLYEQGAGAFEFQRTASRLREMQSADWGASGGDI